MTPILATKNDFVKPSADPSRKPQEREERKAGNRTRRSPVAPRTHFRGVSGDSAFGGRAESGENREKGRGGRAERGRRSHLIFSKVVEMNETTNRDKTLKEIVEKGEAQAKRRAEAICIFRSWNGARRERSEAAKPYGLFLRGIPLFDETVRIFNVKCTS